MRLAVILPGFPPTGGKWEIWSVYRNTFKTIKITCQTAFLKKSGFVFSAILTLKVPEFLRLPKDICKNFKWFHISEIGTH